MIARRTAMALVALENPLFDAAYFDVQARRNIKRADHADKLSDNAFLAARDTLQEIRRRFPEAEWLAIQAQQQIDLGLHYDDIDGRLSRAENHKLIDANQECCKVAIRLLERHLTSMDEGE